jgi:RNA polymerase sigma-70 factor (ECF subfamily)
MHSDGRPNPELLLSAARQGRRECLGTLLELYRNYLYLVARTQLDLHVQAQINPSDLVQEAFLEASRDFGQFRGHTEGELLAWLRRILVHNLAHLVEKVTQAQKRSVRREVSLEEHLKTLDQSAAKVEAALLCQGSSPSAQAQRREQAALLADQLAQLPTTYREVIVLRSLEGLAFEEVARRMGRSSGAVRALWLRALDQLRRLLKKEDLI